VRLYPTSFVPFAIAIALLMVGSAAFLSPFNALIAISGIIAIIALTSIVWAPDWYPRLRLGSVALGLLGLAHVSLLVWHDLPYDIIRALLQATNAPEAIIGVLKGPSESKIPLVVLAFLDITVLGVLWITLRPTILARSTIQIPQELRAPDYRKQLESMARRLERQLTDIDVDTDWSDELFSPLDAEVELRDVRGARRQIRNLVTAIRTDRKSKLFLILGEPGSGKSVALRRLTRLMLQETVQTGILPVYVNLKEWTSSIDETGNIAASVTDLFEFVKVVLRRNADMVVDEFVVAYFEKMFQAGKLFFVFDSFDEIPALLDKDETSDAIEEFSQGLKGLLLGASPCRGILASRQYRKPRISPALCKLLEVRPFSEQQIRSSFLRHPKIARTWIDRLFRETPWMVSQARNPLVSRLIAEYLINSNGELPKALTDCFDSFVANRLDRANSRLITYGISSRVVLDTAGSIAAQMFSRAGVGLEIPLAQLIRDVPNQPVGDVVNILWFCRLIRVGPEPVRLVSFVHRRFNEYFLVRNWQLTSRDVDLTAIADDRRERDALVLYAEVASVQVRADIVTYCEALIRDLAYGSDVSSPSSLPMAGIRGLRFCVDAFARRSAELPDRFRDEVGELLTKRMMSASDDLILAKIATEAVGLLRREAAIGIVSLAIKSGNSWLVETATRGCRYITKLPVSIIGNLRDYIFTMSTGDVLLRASELGRVMSLAESLAPARRALFVRWLDLWLGFALIAIVTSLLGPVITLTLAAASLLLFVAFTLGQRGVRDSREWGVFVVLSDPIECIRLMLCVILLYLSLSLFRFGSFSPDGFAATLLQPTSIEVGNGLLARFRSTSSLSDAWFGAVLLLMAVVLLPIVAKSEITRIGMDKLQDFASFPALRKFMWTFAKILIGYLAFGAGVVVVAIFVPEILGFIGVVGRIAMMCLAAVVIIAFVSAVVLGLWRLARDYQKLARLVVPVVVTRVWIWDEISSLRTDNARLRFLQKLEEQMTGSSSVPIGEWANSTRPDFASLYRSGTRLAQLEARWLKVDR
jgi:hypothetical protein